MTARKPTLCVVAGPNGSGKTTTTVQLLNNEWAADSLYINPDNIARITQRYLGAAVTRFLFLRLFHVIISRWSMLARLFLSLIALMFTTIP